MRVCPAFHPVFPGFVSDPAFFRSTFSATILAAFVRDARLQGVLTSSLNLLPSSLDPLRPSLLSCANGDLDRGEFSLREHLLLSSFLSCTAQHLAITASSSSSPLKRLSPPLLRLLVDYLGIEHIYPFVSFTNTTTINGKTFATHDKHAGNSQITIDNPAATTPDLGRIELLLTHSETEIDPATYAVIRLYN
jgi:hypothetical protein